MANSKNITFDQLQSALARVKKLLDGKANTSHGNHVPKTETANNARFLRNDNTWQTITPVNIGAADRSHSHGSYVNQNAFANIKVGDTTVAADSPTDTLTLTAGANVTLTPDATNDTVTIAAKDTVYTHPTTSGNKHIPSGGSSGQILRWSEDGTAAWGSENNTFTNGSVGGFTVTPNNLVGVNVGMTSSSGHGFALWAGANGVDESNAAPFRVGHEGRLYAYDAVLAGTLDGNATTATKLQAAHKFTIGNTEKSFDGSADVSWTLAEIGAAAASHNHTSLTGITKLQFATEDSDAASISTTVDGANTYFDFNLSDDPSQNDTWRWRFSPSGGSVFNAMTLDASSATAADLVVSGSVTASSFSGNASSATKLQTARTLTIGNTSRSFDGSGNISWSLDEIGAVSPSHTHDRIIDSNNSIIVAQANDYCGLDAVNNVNVATWYGFSISNNCSNTDNYGQVTFSVDARSGQVWTRGTVNAPGFSGALYGNANTATTLANSRKFTIGNTERYFNGSADVSWSLEEIGAAASNHGHSNMLTLRSNHIADWNSATSMADKVYMGGWHGRLTDASKNKGYVSLGVDGTESLDFHLDGDYYANENNLVLNTGNYKSHVTPANIGAAASNHNHGLLHDNLTVTVENTTTDSGWSMINSSYNGFILKSIRSNGSAPDWLQGNYSAGIAFGGADTKGVMSVSYNAPSIRFAGGNGTKPVWNMTLTGTSGKTYNMDSLAANTANTLATARTINGTSFNGSANITTANWGTARTLTIGSTGKSVNGSGNVSWSLDEMGVTSAIQVAENDAKMDIRHNYVTKHEAAHYFEGENKWKLDLYSLGSMSASAAPTKELMIQNNCQYQGSILVEHPSYEGDKYGNNYVGYATTYMHFTEDCQWNGRVVTDDNGNVYLNDVLVLSTPTCQWTNIILNFKAGWNKLEVLYAEGIGGDGWQFDSEIVVVPGGIMDKMNCYGQNSTEEYIKANYSTKSELQQTTNSITAKFSETVAPQHLAISDFSNYSQLRVGHNLSNRHGSAAYVNNDIDNHCYWNNADAGYIPFTVNETVNPFKYGDKVGFKFDAYVQTDLDITIGVWFYSDDYASDYMADRTAGVHLYPGWNSYSTYVTIDCTEVRRARSVAIMIYKGVGNYIEVRNVIISRMISNAMIEDRAITANKLGTIGGFQVEDRLLRGRNGTEGNNYVGMSGDGTGWAFWAGAYNGGDAPFHVGHEGHLYATNATLAGTLDGNATTATRLQNARTFTIGNTGKNFDGTGNISWSIDEIGAAPSSHGHNFMYVKGTNTIGSVNDDTTSNWGAQGNSVHWYAGVEGLLHDQPSSWGYLLNIGQFSEVHQLWMTQASGNLYHRGGNGSGWSGSWRTILDSDNYSTWAAAKSHTHTNLVTKTVSNSTLTLGTELYQYAAISSNTTIKLPSVSAFTEIHLFFNWPANVSVTMPSGVKWQQGVMYGPGHVHEFVFTYVNNIGWLGGCVVYG